MFIAHQKAKPAFTNPTPWQPIIENRSDDSESENRTKRIGPVVRSKRSRRTCVKA